MRHECLQGEIYPIQRPPDTRLLSLSRRDHDLIRSRTLNLETIPESLACCSLEGDPYVILGLRDVHYLQYVCLSRTQSSGEPEGKHVSMNEQPWDTHVSFCPLDLSVSPCQRFLAVATDHQFHLIFALGTHKRLQILSGHSSGIYGKPKTCWSSDSAVLYSNSENERDVYVYSVALGKATHKLCGHTGVVRDLVLDRSDARLPRLYSVSFDHHLIAWKYESVGV